MIYQIIADNTLDAIVLVDNDAIVQYVSPSIYALTGYTQAQYSGMDAFDIIHPDDRDRVRLSHRTVLATHQPVDLEYRLFHAEGQLLYAETRVKPVLDNEGRIIYVVAVVRDVTKRKEMEAAKEESEQRYKSLFENNLDGVFSMDLELNFVHANRSFEAITGIEMDKLTNRCFLGLIYDEDHPSVYETLFQVMQLKAPRELECRIQKGKFGEKIVSITFVPIFLSGQLGGVHGIVKDITQRKKEERELVESEERAKFLQRSINRFAGDLANVMKVSELENRLIEEVLHVLPASSASVVKRRDTEEVTVADGDFQMKWIKISQRETPIYLHLQLDRSLLGIEEEWLETSVHYAAILYDNLHLIEDLMLQMENMVSNNETPKWMLRLLFNLSEKERLNLSSDLHDSVLQLLIVWYRRLELLRSQNPFADKVNDELRQIEEGILDAIHQIRITCNELRPPFLLKMGLVESVKSLLSYVRMFANYEIAFAADGFDAELNEEQLLGIYRIVQELLNNASKHSEAKLVRMELRHEGNEIQFVYTDDGVGMDMSSSEGSFQHMGISGMHNRVLSLGGTMKLTSSPGQGLRVTVAIPKNLDKR